MPTYQYLCTACERPLEAQQRFSDDVLTQCPVCDGRLRKVFSAVGVVFKGSGFYRNDSRAAAQGAEGAGGSGGDTDDTGPGDRKDGNKDGNKDGAPKKDPTPAAAASGAAPSGGAGSGGSRSSSDPAA